jgi:hypothetical protein
MEEETEILKSIYFDDIVKCELDWYLSNFFIFSRLFCFKFKFDFSDKPFLEITIYPSDTEDEENKKSLRINLITLFTKDVRF